MRSAASAWLRSRKISAVRVSPKTSVSAVIDPSAWTKSAVPSLRPRASAGLTDSPSATAAGTARPMNASQRSAGRV